MFIRENWIDILLATTFMIVIFIVSTLQKNEPFTNIEERLCNTYIGKTDELEKVVNKFSRETCEVCSCCAWVKTKDGREKCVATHGSEPVFDSHLYTDILYMGQKLK